MNLQSIIAGLLLPLAAGLLVAGMALVRMAARRWGWSAEIQRKAVHVATGLFCMWLPWLLPQAWLVYGLLVLAIAVMAVLRLPVIAEAGPGSVLHGVERKSWGDFMLVAAVGTLYFFSDEAKVPVLYVLPLAVLSLSDAAAAVAGSAYGRLRYTVEDGQKSIEGSVVFFMVTWVLAMVALLLLSDIARSNVVLLSLMTAAFATLVEAESWRGLDNYFVPVGVLFLISVHMHSSPAALALLALGFLVLLGLLKLYGGAFLGLSHHTARAYTAGLFMIGSMTAPLNVILPAATLVAQPCARHSSPSSARHPDLDMLAMLAVVSFVALIGGVALGRSAISFYETICAAIVALLVLLALVKQSLGVRMTIGAILVLALMATVNVVISLNPAETRWHGPLLPVIAASLLVAVVAGVSRPDFYHHNRHAKVGVTASLFPVASYLFLYARQGGIW